MTAALGALALAAWRLTASAVHAACMAGMCYLLTVLTRRLGAWGRSATFRLGLPAAACVLLSAAVAAAETPPKLLVVLVVDQMRADYVDTYGHQWRAGLRRLLDGGARFERAAFAYHATVTCAGHASVATGSQPARHGMVRNSWWDHAAGAMVTCTTDASETPIAYGGQASERHSPRPIAAPTLADRLRAGPRGARVVSLSLKPRSAITLAGQAGEAVTWFDAGNTWATSTAYARAPVPAVRRFIAANPVEDAFTQVWERARPPADYLHADDGLGERPPDGWTSRFPHPLGDPDATDPAAGGPGSLPRDFYARWQASPYSDDYLARLALALVDAFELGAADRTDYLAIGFSALDYAGHRFGPRSHEVQDVLVRLDATIGGLLEALDARVGRDGYVVALSADHGVSPIPERAAAEGLDAGRIRGRELRSELETWLAARYGPGPHVAALAGGDLYLAPGLYDTLRANAADLAALTALIRRAPGVWRVHTRDELPSAAADPDPVTRAAALSAFEGRSGDLVLIFKPYWIGALPMLAASHGSPHRYDTRVPVLLYGGRIAPGRHAVPASPLDVAPTLAALAGVTLPQVDGRVQERTWPRSTV